jgi:hypothetical protein
LLPMSMALGVPRANVSVLLLLQMLLNFYEMKHYLILFISSHAC